MKRIILALLCPLGVLAQTGTHIEMKVTTTKMVGGKLEMYFDKPGMRMDYTTMSSQREDSPKFKVSTLVKSDQLDTVFRLNESSKSYMAIERKSFSRPDNQKFTATVIGVEKMNGYTCKHVELKGTTYNYEIWTTKEIDGDKYGELLAMDARWGSSSRYQALKSVGADGFPVKMIQKSAQLGETVIELIKFERVILDKTVFEIPADFIRSKRPEAGKGIQNMSQAQRDSAIKEMIKSHQPKTQEAIDKK